MITCLQIHNDYLIPGGETKSVKLIADIMEKNGINVIRYYKNNNELENGGIVSKVKIGAKSLYNRETISEISKIISENNIDFALVHNTSPIISNSIYKVLYSNKIKVFKYLQNYNLLCLNGALDKNEECYKCKQCNLIGIKNKCYKSNYIYSLQKYISKKHFSKNYIDKIDKYIAISEFVKDKHVEYGIIKNKIDVIYHFCENIYENNNYDCNGTYYLYMGRLSTEKGIFTLIKAFEKLPEKKLKIMGTGEIEAEIIRYISENSLTNIELIGFKEGEEKNSIIRNARALIVPSEWDEPFGRIVIESFQYGVPVIASNRGGLPELLDEDRNGKIFISGNIDSLINSIKDMDLKTNEEYFEMKRQCLLDVKQKFSEEIYIKKILETVNAK